MNSFNFVLVLSIYQCCTISGFPVVTCVVLIRVNPLRFSLKLPSCECVVVSYFIFSSLSHLEHTQKPRFLLWGHLVSPFIHFSCLFILLISFILIPTSSFHSGYVMVSYFFIVVCLISRAYSKVTLLIMVSPTFFAIDPIFLVFSFYFISYRFLLLHSNL